MNLPSDEREIETPAKEIDEPPLSAMPHRSDIANLTPKEKQDWLKWLKNLSFIRYVITVMILMYIADVILSIKYPDASFALREPFFEVLKTLLFTVAGYVFAKSSE